MNQTTLEPRLRAALAEKDALKPVFASLWLPYAILLLTVAAFYWNVPAKLAARLKTKPSPRATVSPDLVPSSVNYPVPVRSRWFANPEADSLLAPR